MFTKGKIFLFLVILAGIAAAATLRLTHCSNAASKYSGNSNKQLQTTALELVKRIRELADSFYKKDRELMADYQATYLSARTTERQKLREQYAKNLKEANDSTVRTYKETFLPESKAVRAELLRRLPPLRRPDLSKTYENPSIVREIQIIADDLELLSKSLPDT
jgi:hypothetical protein